MAFEAVDLDRVKKEVGELVRLLETLRQLEQCEEAHSVAEFPAIRESGFDKVSLVHEHIPAAAKRVQAAMPDDLDIADCGHLDRQRLDAIRGRASDIEAGPVEAYAESDIILEIRSLIGSFDSEPVMYHEDTKEQPEDGQAEGIDDTSRRLLAAMDNNELKIVQIADSEMSVEKRWRLILEIDERFKGKESPELATLFGCTDAYIRKLWKKHPDLRYQKEEE